MPIILRLAMLAAALALLASALIAAPTSAWAIVPALAGIIVFMFATTL